MRPFDKLKLSDHEFTRIDGNQKNCWDVPVLIQFAKENNYKVFDLPLDGIPLSIKMWKLNNMRDFAYHMFRVNNADSKYPILIDDFGDICDGWHRVIKAVIEGKKSIKAIRLEEMPSPSRTENV